MQQIYRCKRCASVFDFANKKEGRLCDHCGASLVHHGEEPLPWAERSVKDYDVQGAA